MRPIKIPLELALNGARIVAQADDAARFFWVLHGANTLFLRRMPMNLRRLAIILIAMGGVLAHYDACARINVVTLPDRDSVQLTIYNSSISHWLKTSHFQEGPQPSRVLLGRYTYR